MKAWGLGHVGRAREINEDSFILHISSDQNVGYFAICDGMGGANAGEIASEEAVISFADEIALSLGDDMTVDYMQEMISRAAEKANEHIFALANKNPEFYGMGTTLVGVIIHKHQAIIANIGDSRAYLIDEKQGIRLITQDHNLVFEMIKRGEISAAEGVSHPSRNVITRALGVESQVRCDTFALELEPGQRLLLCSDGLTNEISEEDILKQVLAGDDGYDVCKALIDMANANGGHDNITVLLIAV